MNKILNWTLGSFFRTLGRILVYLLIGYILFNLINFSNIKFPSIFNVLDVYASSYQMGDLISNTTFEINDVAITTNNKRYLPANSNVNFHLESTNVWEPANNDIDYQYGYLAICASSEFTPNNFVAGYNSKNARFFNSFQSCQVANSNYDTAMIYYITWQINIDRVCVAGVTNTYCSLDNNYDFTIDKAMEFSLIDFGLSNEQINVDTSNGLVIQQNQTIINSIGNLNTNINNTENAINYNGEQGRLNDDKNTDKLIDSNRVCNKYDKNDIEKDGYYLNINGNEITSTYFGITNFIKVDGATMKYLVDTSGFSGSFCFYNINKIRISCTSINQQAGNITIPTDASYIKVSINKSYNKPQFEICKNGNQAMADALTDDTPPSNLDSLNNSAGWLPSGPVDSILNLPLSFLTNLNNNLSKSCETINLPLPYINKTLPLPCVNSLYAQINGLPDWINTIGIIASAFILFGYFINLYKYIDDTLTFRENNYIDNWSGV